MADAASETPFDLDESVTSERSFDVESPLQANAALARRGKNRDARAARLALAQRPRTSLSRS